MLEERWTSNSPGPLLRSSLQGALLSARVRLLEQQLGRPRFVRNKAGATLTPAGELFLRFAPTFVQLWRRARQQGRTGDPKYGQVEWSPDFSLHYEVSFPDTIPSLVTNLGPPS